MIVCVILEGFAVFLLHFHSLFVYIAIVNCKYIDLFANFFLLFSFLEIDVAYFFCFVIFLQAHALQIECNTNTDFSGFKLLYLLKGEKNDYRAQVS